MMHIASCRNNPHQCFLPHKSNNKAPAKSGRFLSSALVDNKPLANATEDQAAFFDFTAPFSGLGPIALVCSVISVAISANLGPMADDKLNICTRSGSMPSSFRVR
jgi:hypothetical protein